jgi:hypothetical protein
MNPTDKFVLALAVLASLWEAWTLLNKRPADTISETVWRAVARRPIVPFLLGMLMGHFVWQAASCMEALR